MQAGRMQCGIIKTLCFLTGQRALSLLKLTCGLCREVACVVRSVSVINFTVG